MMTMMILMMMMTVFSLLLLLLLLIPTNIIVYVIIATGYSGIHVVVLVYSRCPVLWVRLLPQTQIDQTLLLKPFVSFTDDLNIC